MIPVPECLVMAKPAGPGRNMRCGYCYYLRAGTLFPKGPWRMPEDLLERYIVQRLEASPGPSTHFEWHGGEPTLLGLDYSGSIAALQEKHRPPGGPSRTESRPTACSSTMHGRSSLRQRDSPSA